MADIGIEYFIHHDLYGVALEVSKKFVGKSETRPLLKYTYHDISGNIIATDSHRAIKIRKIHGFKEDYLINPKNYMVAKGTYPDTEKLITREGYNEAIMLSKEHLKIWLQLFRSINQTLKVLKSYDKLVTCNFSDSEDHIDIELYGHSIKLSLPCIVSNPGFDKIGFNAEYMRDALEAHVKLNAEQLTIYLKSSMRQIIMDDEKLVETVLLPVRIYPRKEEE